jgi:hypothetical protein
MLLWHELDRHRYSTVKAGTFKLSDLVMGGCGCECWCVWQIKTLSSSTLTHTQPFSSWIHITVKPWQASVGNENLYFRYLVTLHFLTISRPKGGGADSWILKSFFDSHRYSHSPMTTEEVYQTFWWTRMSLRFHEDTCCLRIYFFSFGQTI